MPKEPRTKRDEKTDDTDKRDVTVYLNVSLHRELKVYAARNDQSVSAVVEEVLAAFLSSKTTEH